MSAAGWGCPHDDQGECLKRNRPCEAGAEGCVLAGRTLSDDAPKVEQSVEIPEK